MGWIFDGLEKVRNSFRGNGKTVTKCVDIFSSFGALFTQAIIFKKGYNVLFYGTSSSFMGILAITKPSLALLDHKKDYDDNHNTMQEIDNNIETTRNLLGYLNLNTRKNKDNFNKIQKSFNEINSFEWDSTLNWSCGWQIFSCLASFVSTVGFCIKMANSDEAQAEYLNNCYLLLSGAFYVMHCITQSYYSGAFVKDREKMKEIKCSLNEVNEIIKENTRLTN